MVSRNVKLMKIGVAGADLPDAVLAHEHRRTDYRQGAATS